VVGLGAVTQLCKINDLQEDEGAEHRIARTKEFSVLPSSSLCRLDGTAELQVQSWQSVSRYSGAGLGHEKCGAKTTRSTMDFHHLVRDEGVAGSNPATPTNTYQNLTGIPAPIAAPIRGDDRACASGLKS